MYSVRNGPEPPQAHRGGGRRRVWSRSPITAAGKSKTSIPAAHGRSGPQRSELGRSTRICSPSFFRRRCGCQYPRKGVTRPDRNGWVTSVAKGVESIFHPAEEFVFHLKVLISRASPRIIGETVLGRLLYAWSRASLRQPCRMCKKQVLNTAMIHDPRAALFPRHAPRSSRRSLPRADKASDGDLGCESHRLPTQAPTTLWALRRALFCKTRSEMVASDEGAIVHVYPELVCCDLARLGVEAVHPNGDPFRFGPQLQGRHEFRAAGHTPTAST